MEQAIRIGIDSSVQPVLLRIDLNHDLIDRNLVRAGTVCRLSISLLYPPMDVGPVAIDT